MTPLVMVELLPNDLNIKKDYNRLFVPLPIADIQVMAKSLAVFTMAFLASTLVMTHGGRGAPYFKIGGTEDNCAPLAFLAAFRRGQKWS